MASSIGGSICVRTVSDGAGGASVGERNGLPQRVAARAATISNPVRIMKDLFVID
jgi:hypothetical protein